MTSSALFSSGSGEWETPQKLFDKLNSKFGFTLDVCATEKNAKCQRFFTLEDNGLARPWVGERCWMNPPYGRDIADWVAKAKVEAIMGTLVVGLLPARTDTRWWHTYVQGSADVRFIEGRLKFGNAKNSAPFPSAIAIWWGWPVNWGDFA